MQPVHPETRIAHTLNIDRQQRLQHQQKPDWLTSVPLHRAGQTGIASGSSKGREAGAMTGRPELRSLHAQASCGSHCVTVNLLSAAFRRQGARERGIA